LEETIWEYLFSFENRKKIFSNIHGSFKFCVILFQKGTSNQFLKTSFMRRDLLDWENLNVKILKYNIDAVLNFSPIYKIILEIEKEEDLKLLMKIHV
ncbi:unnamed protein product, partial [marine sediment metagenome]